MWRSVRKDEVDKFLEKANGRISGDCIKGIGLLL